VPADPKDPDQWKNWCPPGIAKATKGLQAKFGPGLKLKKPAELRSQGMETFYPVSGSKDETRAAKIRLIAGQAAILSDGGDGQLCLCQPKSRIPDLLFGDQCPASWKRSHRERAKPADQGICQKGDDAGVMPFGKDGGRIVLKPQPPGAVRIE
jgi:hypothetical protein